MSVRRRARERRRTWSGWVDDGHGAMHVRAGRPPVPEDVAVLLELRDTMIGLQMRAEREAGRWEDDGGPPAPEATHRTYSLVTGRQAGRRPDRWTA